MSRSRALSVAMSIAGVSVLAALAACGDDGPDTNMPIVGDEPAATPSAIEGVEVVDGLTNDHAGGRVDYPDAPPAGGDHAQAWLNCAVYQEPVPDENAVHALEHGVVWFAHDPDLPDDEVARLRALHEQRPDRVIVSPYPDIDAPVVAVAWGRRLEVETANDPRLADFLDAFVDGDAAPEPGAPCEGGIG